MKPEYFFEDLEEFRNELKNSESPQNDINFSKIDNDKSIEIIQKSPKKEKKYKEIKNNQPQEKKHKKQKKEKKQPIDGSN